MRRLSILVGKLAIKPSWAIRSLNIALLVFFPFYIFHKVPRFETSHLKAIEPVYGLVAFLFVFINYFIEIKKWQILREIPLALAAKEVLVGLFYGVFTPFMIGDYLGRASFSTNTMKIVKLAFYNGLIQSSVAIFYAFLSILFVYGLYAVDFLYYFVFTGFVMGTAWLISILLLSTGFDGEVFGKKMSIKVPKLKLRYSSYGFTLLRNFVYFVQYFLVFRFFGIDIAPELIFAGVNLILFFKTFGPGLNFIGDLSFRSIIGVHFFEHFGVPASTILAISFGIWGINIVFPAIVGCIINLQKK